MVSELIPARKNCRDLGMSYKPSTPVIEESQGMMLAKSLKDTGFAVVAHDPMAACSGQSVLGDTVRFFSTTRETIAACRRRGNSHAMARICGDFARLDHQTAVSRFIIDCWRQLVPESF